ncbi:probable serine/threonine-protein kinase kinX [Protopterus annectens]|uniref:probable serine/threonine-protein kinase kinX n=1 Tax=Protopterus annectens TaxID=7888 RepID=UPI001CFB6AA4|nr:probable serine/threonine-protein kinase kinX [Protopterus annectens]
MVQQKNENKTGSAAKGNLYDRVDELHNIAEMQSELPSVDLVVKTCQNVYDGDAERISDPQQDTSVEVGLFQCSGAVENASGASLSTVAEETEEKCQTAAGHSKRKGRISFAPQHFVFQPLEGISSYKFNPMTPHSTEKFLSPCFTWSPLEAKRDKHLKLEDHMISVEQHRADATATLQKEMKISKNALEEEMKEFSQSAPEEEMDVSESDPEEEEMKDISEIDQQKEEMKDVSRDLPVEEMKGVSEDAHVEEIKGTSEDVPVEEMKGVSEDVPVEEMKGISENAPVEEMKGVSEDVPVEEMKGISENVPVEEMKGVSEDAPVEEMNGVSEDALVEKIKEVSSCVVEDVIKEEPLKEVGSVIEVMPTPSVFAQEASGTAEKLCSIQTLDNVHDVPYFVCDFVF